MIEYTLDAFVWFVQSSLISDVIAIAVAVAIVKLIYHLFRRVQ